MSSKDTTVMESAGVLLERLGRVWRDSVSRHTLSHRSQSTYRSQVQADHCHILMRVCFLCTLLHCTIGLSFLRLMMDYVVCICVKAYPILSTLPTLPMLRMLPTDPMLQ